jgi:hypothetical protein
MDIKILFYTRHDFGGWRKYMWLPVKWAQGAYVHCEVVVGGDKRLNADNKKGVIWDKLSPYTASGSFTVEVDMVLFYSHVEKVLGEQYSWEGFVKLLWPRWGSDPKGMICSELVAYVLRSSAIESKYRYPFIAVPPYRWTPNQVYEALMSMYGLEGIEDGRNDNGLAGLGGRA